MTIFKYFNPKTCFLIVLPLIFISLSSCTKHGAFDFSPIDSQNSEISDNLDTELKSLIAKHKITGTFTSTKPVSIENEQAQLGKLLFFTKELSGNKDTACASCHHPLLGGADARALAIGANAVDPSVLGPNRKHIYDAFALPELARRTPRNSPTTFNTAFYTKTLFHDGRVERLAKGGIRTPDELPGQPDPYAGETLLAAQAKFPVVADLEMRGNFTFQHPSDHDKIRQELVERFNSNFTWQDKFCTLAELCGSKDNALNYQHISDALDAYQRSQKFTDNVFFRYINGTIDQLEPNVKRGAYLFYAGTDKGGLSCVSCHAGDHFTNEEFYNVNFPQTGPGKGDGESGLEDFGRYDVSGDISKIRAFRTPSLLNIALTAPYGHSGSIDTLAEAVESHYIEKLDGDLVADAALTTLIGTKPSPEQISDITAFLHALTDTCTQDIECMEPWMPNQEELLVQNMLLLNAIIE